MLLTLRILDPKLGLQRFGNLVPKKLIVVHKTARLKVQRPRLATNDITEKLFLTSFVCFSHDSAIRGCLRLLARSEEATEAAETVKRRRRILLPTSTTNESPSTENIWKTGKEEETERNEERKIVRVETDCEKNNLGEDKDKEEETMEEEHERRIKGDVIREIERKKEHERRIKEDVKREIEIERENLGEDKDTERDKHGKEIKGDVEIEKQERERKGKYTEDRRETDKEKKKSWAKNVDAKKGEKLFNPKVKRNEEGAKRFEKTLFTNILI